MKVRYDPSAIKFLLPEVGTYNKRNPMADGDLAPPLTVATPRRPMGMEEEGNINLNTRPYVWNQGATSTVYSMSFEQDGQHILVPQVNDEGGIDTPDEAIARYEKTGKHLGKFSTSEMADDYAERLHKQQEAKIQVPVLDYGLAERAASGDR